MVELLKYVKWYTLVISTKVVVSRNTILSIHLSSIAETEKWRENCPIFSDFSYSQILSYLNSLSTQLYIGVILCSWRTFLEEKSFLKNQLILSNRICLQNYIFVYIGHSVTRILHFKTSMDSTAPELSFKPLYDLGSPKTWPPEPKQKTNIGKNDNLLKAPSDGKV